MFMFISLTAGGGDKMENQEKDGAGTQQMVQKPSVETPVETPVETLEEVLKHINLSVRM